MVLKRAKHSSPLPLPSSLGGHHLRGSTHRLQATAQSLSRVARRQETIDRSSRSSYPPQSHHNSRASSIRSTNIPHLVFQTVRNTRRATPADHTRLCQQATARAPEILATTNHPPSKLSQLVVEGMASPTSASHPYSYQKPSTMVCNPTRPSITHS